MPDWAVSTNLISWIPAKHGIFGWPDDGHEAEVVRGMQPGDLIVPKFAQWPAYGADPEQEKYQQAIAAVLDADYEQERQAYVDTVAWGAGAVPFVMRVVRQRGDDRRFPSYPPHAWASVEVELDWLPHPISTSEFLRLRVVPIELAGQFKGMAARNRHIQRLPAGAGAQVLAAGQVPDRGPELLRRQSLVRAADPTEAAALLGAAGFWPEHDDRAFLVTEEGMPGLHVCVESGVLEPQGEPIAVAPFELRPLLEEAKAKAVRSDYFSPARALQGARDLEGFLASGEDVREVVEFPHFHDRFVILPRKTTEALTLQSRQATPDRGTLADEAPDDGDDAEDAPEELELDALLGLTVEAVRAELPPGTELPQSVLAEAVTALRSGKHLLLSGPPGTGKSMLAGALCRAVMESRYRVTTATADWTTFDTIGGYVPHDGSGLEFEPGVVLRCLQTGSWLVIDELNRADIDKAFGPLFTLLAGTTGEEVRETVLLPYRQNGKNVEVSWAKTVSKATTRYAVTPSWRLLGTMNASDKATLFQLSFAFLRRFAVVDVPLPDETAYRTLLAARVAEVSDLSELDRGRIVDAAMAIAFGPVQLGPAILLDIARFIERGLVRGSGGSSAYDDPVVAFLTAVRLYAVPQYEGAAPEDVAAFTGLLQAVWPDPPGAPWAALGKALAAISLAGT